MNHIILVDDREKIPLPIERELPPGWSILQDRLETGDYSIEGRSHLLAIERKKPAELLRTCGAGRELFSAELRRMRIMNSFKVGGYAAILIEGTLRDIESLKPGDHGGRVTAAHVLGSLAAWSVDWGIPVWFGGNVESCARLVVRLFRAAARVPVTGELKEE